MCYLADGLWFIYLSPARARLSIKHTAINQVACLCTLWCLLFNCVKVRFFGIILTKSLTLFDLYPHVYSISLPNYIIFWSIKIVSHLIGSWFECVKFCSLRLVDVKIRLTNRELAFSRLVMTRKVKFLDQLPYSVRRNEDCRSLWKERLKMRIVHFRRVSYLPFELRQSSYLLYFRSGVVSNRAHYFYFFIFMCFRNLRKIE